MTDDASKLVPSAAAKRRPPNAGKGRPKGVPNKSTAAVKAALTEAFERLGGVDALVKWGQGSPTEFYKLWGRLLPTEVSGPGGGPIETRDLTDQLGELPKAKRDAIRASIAAALKEEG